MKTMKTMKKTKQMSARKDRGGGFFQRVFRVLRMLQRHVDTFGEYEGVKNGCALFF